MHRFISRLSILFHWSIFPFLSQYHTVLMTVSLQYNLKSGRLIPPAPIFFLRKNGYSLAIRGLLCFHMNCEMFCSSSVKNAIGRQLPVVTTLISNLIISKIIINILSVFALQHCQMYEMINKCIINVSYYSQIAISLNLKHQSL